MLSTRRIIAAVFALLPLLSNSQTAPASSTFVLPTNGGKNFTFAVNVPTDSEDIYFHLSGPSGNSYIAIGNGDEMQDSLMILVYKNQHGNNITISPRLCSGHVEPVYESNLDVEILPGSGIFHDIYVLNARCKNCRRWKTGSLDVKSSEQSWIYALGPDVSMESDARTVSIERHSEYGRFKINMIQATGIGGVPTLTGKTSGAVEDGAPTQDSNWPSIIHALVLCLSFIILMPLGVIFLRVIERVRWHWANQLLATGVAVIGTGLGLYLASMFNKSKNYSSAHQILGLVVIAFLLIQFSLGFWHHRLYKATQKTTIYAPIHRYLGQIVILGGIINGGIGFTFSRASTSVIIGYSVTVIISAILTVGPVARKRFLNSGSQAYKRRPTDGQGRSANGPWDSSSSRSDVNLTRWAQVPGASREDIVSLPYTNGRGM